MFVTEIPINYKFVLHAHSHTAMLGWAYPMVSGVLVFFHRIGVSDSRMKLLLVLNVISGLGMAVSFLIQGYGPISIAFSGLHLVSAYLFAYFFLRKSTGTRASDRLARWGVIWMMISTAGLLAIGPVSTILGNNHPVYYSAIQFFLHFQFNGWFTFAVLSLLYRFAENQGRSPALGPVSFWLLQLSLVLTYALSITWSTPETFLFYLNSVGVLLQLSVVGLIIYRLWISLYDLNFPSESVRMLLFLGLISLGGKIVAQSLAAVPAIAEISYTIRNFVIGFIHLVMLGSITLTVIAVSIYENFLPVDRLARVGYIILIAAFLSTEFVLFGQGILLWSGVGFIDGYYGIIFGATCLFPIGIGIVAISTAKHTQKQTLIINQTS